MKRAILPEKYQSVHAIIGDRIKIHRRLRGWSQHDLAEKLGTTFQQLQKYEKGINKVEIGRLFHIADIFDVPISVFLDGAIEGASFHGIDGAVLFQAPQPTDMRTDGNRAVLIATRLLLAMPEHLRQPVLRLIRSIYSTVGAR
jgi:transcriptional regulator with XRE-family HTH domain